MELNNLIKPFQKNNYLPVSEFWNLQQASELTGLKESKLRKFAREKKVKWYSSGGHKIYYFRPDELIKNLKEIPATSSNTKQIKKFKSSFTRFDFALLFKLFVEANILPGTNGNKKLYCEYLVNNGLYDSIKTTSKMFSELNTTPQKDIIIKQKFTKKVNNLLHLLNK